MADYNVQMKQYNGTSFDNILPYASQALTLAGGGGATEIIAQARAGLSQIATGSYVGNGQTNLNIALGFKPKFIYVTLALDSVEISTSASIFVKLLSYRVGEYETSYDTPGYNDSRAAQSMLYVENMSADGKDFIGVYYTRGYGTWYTYRMWVVDDTSFSVSYVAEHDDNTVSGVAAICNSSNAKYAYIAFG